MSGKTLSLLALIASILFVYTCVSSKKDEIYKQVHENNEVRITQPVITMEEFSQKTVIVPKKAEKEKVVSSVSKQMRPPSFAYVGGEKKKIAGIFSPKERDSKLLTNIADICKNGNCIQEIKYIDQVKAFDFTDETFSLIAYAEENNISDFAVYIDKKSVKVEGTYSSSEQNESIKPYLTRFVEKGYTLYNTIHSKEAQPLLGKDILQEELTPQAQEIPVSPKHISREEASRKINAILSKQKITFQYKSSAITKESKKTLDEVIDILLELDDISIEVAGYTDASGDAIYNKVLSQKRADSVQQYLIQSGIRAKLIKSTGYGEEQLIAQANDSANRRVEIHLKEGK